MSDLISRRAAIDIVRFECGEWEGLAKTIIKRFEQLPSAQPEHKRGKWIESNTHTYGIYECTACRAWTYIPNEPRDYNFCPRCGADMREDDHEAR